MKKFIVAIICLLKIAASEASVSRIECPRYSLEGAVETLSLQSDGSWLLNNSINGGMNRSKNPTTLDLYTFTSFGSDGLKLQYDSAKKTMTYKFKYTSDIDGLARTQGGTFTRCVEL